MLATRKLWHLLLGRKVITNLDSTLKSRGITWLTEAQIVKAMVFPVVMYRCENWTIKKAEHWIWFQTVVLEKTLESPLDSKETKPVNPKGNQPWIFIGSSYAEALILWPPDVNSQLTGNNPDAGKDWEQKNRAKEDKIIGWHHRLNGHEFEQTLGDGEGPGSLVCCSPWGCKKSDTT